MTIKQFIEKAIEGGWKLRGADINVFRVTMQLVDVRLTWRGDQYSKDEEEQTVVAIEVILLDPLAWQAVEKVKGNDLTPDMPKRRARLEMVGMIHALNDGKTIEEYLKTL